MMNFSGQVMIKVHVAYPSNKLCNTLYTKWFMQTIIQGYLLYHTAWLHGPTTLFFLTCLSFLTNGSTLTKPLLVAGCNQYRKHHVASAVLQAVILVMLITKLGLSSTRY